MKRTLIFTLALLTGITVAQAQPKSRVQKDADKKSETTLSERAKAQYTGQMPTPDDVVWQRGIYRTLDLTKEKNAALYYPVEPLGDQCNMFTLIIRLVADGKVPAYEYRSDGNELFTEANKYKVNELLEKFYIYYEEKGGRYVIEDADIPSGDVLSYFIKESTYYDQRTATSGTRVTAICPVLHRSGDFGDEVTKYPMFWLNYDEVSAYFGRTPVMTSSYNNVTHMSLDDYFVTHQYDGEIYKTANLQNKLLAETVAGDSTGTALKAAQDRIENELKGFEDHLWGTEEPDTTAVDEGRHGRSSRRVKSPANAAPKEKTAAKSTSSKTKAAPKAKATRTPKAKAAPKEKASKSSSGTLSVRREKR